MRTKAAILAICGTFLGGCGTFSDAMCGPVNDNVYYRGVRLDVEAVKEGGSKSLMAADIPFSAVADSVLAPYIGCQHLEQSAGPPTSTSQPQEPK